MSKDWQPHVDAAIVDITAALTGSEAQTLQHLRDAAENLRLAIEALENRNQID